MEPVVRSTIKEYIARHFDQSIDQVTVRKLAGGASTRQYFRVRLADGQTVVVARYPEPVDATTHSMCQVTRLFLQAGLPVPRILDVREKEGLMLHDDLGDLGVDIWLASASEDERRDAYRKAIDLLLRIQDATQLAIDTNNIAARLAFDEQKLGWELAFFYQHFFESYLKNPLDSDRKQRLFDEFSTISRELAALPRVLCHRDYHSRNLMLHQGRMFIVDHQDARMGPVSYDLASLLGDPYVALNDDFCQEMYERFVERRMADSEAGFTRSWRIGFEREYQLMLIQRLIKATGSYAYQIAVAGNDAYRRFIPRAIQGALNAIQALNRFPSTRSVLEPYGSLPAPEGIGQR